MQANNQKEDKLTLTKEEVIELVQKLAKAIEEITPVLEEYDKRLSKLEKAEDDW